MTGVDFHQHVWPDAFRRALEERTEPPFLHGATLTLPRGGSFEIDVDAHTPEARLAELDRNGLERAVVSLAPTCEPTAELATVWNEAARELPDRLVPLAYEEALPGFAGAIVGAPELRWLDCVAPLLDRLERDGGILFVHPAAAPGNRAGWETAGVAYTAQMHEAFVSWLGGGAERWPELRVVFAFLGGGAPFHIERMVRRGLDPLAPFSDNVWFETSSYGERALDLSLQTFGAGRLLFGSDAPVDRVAPARATLERLGRAVERQLLETGPLALLDERQPCAA
jgi:6-methylsalicylate decarboxylase